MFFILFIDGIFYWCLHKLFLNSISFIQISPVFHAHTCLHIYMLFRLLKVQRALKIFSITWCKNNNSVFPLSFSGTEVPTDHLSYSYRKGGKTHLWVWPGRDCPMSLPLYVNEYWSGFDERYCGCVGECARDSHPSAFLL